MSHCHPLSIFTYCPRCGSTPFEADSERSKQCKVCGFTYYANASASVAAIIRNSRGEILLTTRAYEPAKGMLDLPGGFVDHNETAENALHREIAEELGIEIKSIRYLLSQPNTYSYSGMDIHTLDMFFEVEMEPNSKIEAHDDVADAQFYWLSDVVLDKIGLDSIKRVLTDIYNDQEPNRL